MIAITKFYFDMVFPVNIILSENIILVSFFRGLFYIFDDSFKDHRFASQISTQNIFKIKKKKKKEIFIIIQINNRKQKLTII
jgi:hypothetical protein